MFVQSQPDVMDITLILSFLVQAENNAKHRHAARVEQVFGQGRVCTACLWSSLVDRNYISPLVLLKYPDLCSLN